MAQHNKKRQLIITTSVTAGLLLLVIGGIVVAQSLAGRDKADPYKQQNIENTRTDETSSAVTETDEDIAAENSTPDTSTEQAPALDPATVATIDITQLGITVSYVKGVGGFEYVVKRTPGGSQYVEFRNESLKGTKCTDDQGAFASIIENPTSSDAATLTEKKTVGSTEYGLSLAADSCTSNTELLKRYQDSFKSAFSLLKQSTASAE